MRHLSVTILLLALFACTAEPTLPEIEVRKVTEITETGATLRADIISSGNAYITSREFLWGTDPSLTKYKRLGAGDGENPIVCHLFGLAPATTYYFKLKVENAAGSVESQTLSFNCQVKNAEGFIHVANSKFLRQDAYVNGQRKSRSYFPVGPNVAWYDAAD